MHCVKLQDREMFLLSGSVGRHPITNVDDLNTDIGPWMFLFTETLTLCSFCFKAFCTSLCSFFLFFFTQFVFREMCFAQRKQGCKKKVHSKA